MAGRFYVASPPFTPAQFGLLSVATLIDEADPHWRNGVQAELQSCRAASLTYDGCVSVTDPQGSTNPTKTAPRGVTTQVSEPFTLYGAFHCAPVGHAPADVESRAGEALVRGEGRTLERVFEIGYSDLNGETAPDATDVVNPNLNDAATTVVAGTFPAVTALGILEKKLGLCYGGVGVIHMDRYMATVLSTNGTLYRDGSRLRTDLGTLVAAGTGYLGSGAGALANEWMYATGAVTVRRSPVEFVGDFSSTIDRATNDVFFIAERTYVVSVDCCQFSIKTDEVYR